MVGKVVGSPKSGQSGQSGQSARMSLSLLSSSSCLLSRSWIISCNTRNASKIIKSGKLYNNAREDWRFFLVGGGPNITAICVWGYFREDPFRLTPPTFGHCPNSDPPPPHSTGHSGALFFGPFFTILQGCMLPKTVSAPNHLGKRLDPPKNKDMPI